MAEDWTEELPQGKREALSQGKLAALAKAHTASMAALHGKRRNRCAVCGKLTTKWKLGHLAHLRACRGGTVELPDNGRPRRHRHRTVRQDQWLPKRFVRVSIGQYTEGAAQGKSAQHKTIYVRGEQFAEVVEAVRKRFADQLVVRPLGLATAKRAVKTLGRLDKDSLRRLLEGLTL